MQAPSRQTFTLNFYESSQDMNTQLLRADVQGQSSSTMRATLPLVNLAFTEKPCGCVFLYLVIKLEIFVIIVCQLYLNEYVKTSWNRKKHYGNHYMLFLFNR